MQFTRLGKDANFLDSTYKRNNQSVQQSRISPFLDGQKNSRNSPLLSRRLDFIFLWHNLPTCCPLPLTRPEGWEGIFYPGAVGRRDSYPNRRRDEATAALITSSSDSDCSHHFSREASQSRRDWHGSSQDAAGRPRPPLAAASAGAGICRARDSAPFCCVVTTATRAHHTCPQGMGRQQSLPSSWLPDNALRQVPSHPDSPHCKETKQRAFGQQDGLHCSTFPSPTPQATLVLNSLRG